MYPQALGSSTSQDSVLKAQLTGYANDLITEIDREQRWTLSFAEPTFATVNGTQTYALPFPTGGTGALLSQTFVDRIWWVDPSSGKITRLQRFAKEELQRVFGDVETVNGAFINTGSPLYYCIESPTTNFGNPTLTISLYPCPDNNGPTSGNYTITMSGYFNTPPIFEVPGTSAVSTTFTWASGTNTYLTNQGEPTSSATLGLTVSIRSAGPPGPGGSADTHVTTWTAMAATTMTLAVAQSAAGSTIAYLNSTNWIIRYWPKLIEFGMLREVSNYYGKADQYAMWEARYQDQLKKLRDYEFDMSRSNNAHVVAYPGADMSALRTSDVGVGLVDIRGGG